MKKKTEMDEFNELLKKMEENRACYFDSPEQAAERDRLVKAGIAKYGGMTEFLREMDFELTEMQIAEEEFRENLQRIERDYAAEIEADEKLYPERMEMKRLKSLEKIKNMKLPKGVKRI